VKGRPRFAAALVTLLVAAAGARVAVLLALDPHTWVAGSDTPYYVTQGWLLAHGQAPVFAAVAPGYIWVVAAAWRCFPQAPQPAPAEAIPVGLLTVVRAAQVVLSVAMAGVVALLARRASRCDRAALLAATGLALAPGQVLEPFRVLTETMFLLLLVVGVSLWSVRDDRSARRQILAGLVLGFAALVRPVVLGVPLALAGMELSSRRSARRWRAAAFLLAVAVPLLPWSVSLRRHTGSWAPAGLAANLWIGAVGDGRWHGAKAMDARRSRFAGGPDDYFGEVIDAFRASPGGWLVRRTRNLAGALLQPHFAPEVPGPSTRAEVAHWWRTDRSPAALLAVLATPAALAKGGLYAFHLLALAGGLAGLLRWRSRWRDLVPVWVIVLYFPLVHVFLTATPRYLLPLQPALWVGVGLLLTPPAAADSTATAATRGEGA